MVAIVKPDFENIWASEGGVTPPTLEQILSGWKQNQFPPSEISNYLQKRVDSAIAYLFQNGLSEWDKKIEYQKSSLVKFGDKHYISKVVNTNKTPSTENSYWRIAFDEYGASNDLREELSKIMGVDGYVPYYVKKSDPVMLGKAKAPSFEADVGITKGYSFKGYQSGVYCLGGDLHFTSGGVTNGRIKNTPPTLEMNDDTLVTTALLNKVIEQIKKDTQIPIGWSVITTNKKPPSDKDQLGYGTWKLDVQGRALVGATDSTAINAPEWTMDADSQHGEYEHTVTIAELPRHRMSFPADDQLIESFDLERNKDLQGRGYDAKSSQESKWASGWAFTNYVGEGKPMNVVQPSQVKFIWTRIA